jgi:transcriptional regulator with XRE-family HTH domain
MTQVNDYHVIINMKETGENIEKLRLKRGISVKELEEIFGFNTPQSIYKWQRGESLPTIDNMVVLARIIGVSVDDLISLEKA